MMTTAVAMDPAVISVLPPIGQERAALLANPAEEPAKESNASNGAVTDGGLTSDGGQSGNEQKGNTPDKKKRRANSRRNRARSNGEGSNVQAPTEQQQVQQQPHRSRSRQSSGGSAAASPQAHTEAQPQHPAKNTRRNGRRGRSQSFKNESDGGGDGAACPVPPVLQTLFGQQPVQQQQVIVSQHPPTQPRSPRSSSRNRANSLSSSPGGRRGSFGAAQSHPQNFNTVQPLNISAENVHFQRGGGLRSTFPYRGSRGFIQQQQPMQQNGTASLPLKPGYSNEFVSKQIMEYHFRNRQTNERYKAKQILRQALENILVQSYPGYAINLHLIGSTTNGVGDNTSSVDICMLARPSLARALTTPPPPISSPDVAQSNEVAGHNKTQTESSTETGAPDAAAAAAIVETKEPVKTEETVKDEAAKSTTEVAEEKTEQRPDASPGEEEVVRAAADSNADSDGTNPAHVHHSSAALTLESIEQLLHSKTFAKDIKMITARVPIIKFKDAICNLDVTLNLNQDVSIRNSQLIRDYAKMDWRFPQLAMVIKQWAKENHLNSAVDKSISNYSWTLLVIHYLQVVEPPVLPCLQKLNPRRYDPRTPIDQALVAWRKPPPKWRSINNSNLRNLLKSMLRYYGYVFHYDQHVISVREGRALDKESVVAPRNGEPNHPTQWNSFLCVEEPFSRTNTTRSVHDKERFEHIIELLRMAATAMRGGRISLFNIIADDIEHPISY